MATTITFTGAAFTVNNAVQTAQNTIRVTFSQPPLASSAAGVNDSLNPNNYTLIGPSVTSVLSVMLTGTTEVELTLVAPLVAGLWNITFTNIHSASAVLQSPNPTVLSFTATDVFVQPPLGLGALNRNSEEALKRHSGIFSGKTNWDALWAALGSGDDINLELAQDIYEQLFPSLASGGYLKERASDDGISFPYGIGLTDDVIRKIILRTKNNKLTLQSFLDVLNAFYSDKKTRAFITTTNAQPFALTDQDTLILEIDGDRVEAIFDSESFTNIGAATAEEVANELNAEFSRLNLRCVARADYDPISLQTYVSIFSGALGLKGYIKVRGGVAQKALNLPELLETTQDATTVWTLTQQTAPGKFRVTSPSGTAPSFNLLQSEDYVVFTSSNMALVNRGTFAITEVGSTYFDIENLKGAAQTFTQGEVDGALFYRPTKYDINKIELPAFASQYSEATDVILPATIDLERDYDDATYLGSDPSYTKTYLVNDSKILIDNFTRTSNVITINTNTNHGLAVGEKVLFSPSSVTVNEHELVVASTPTATSLTASSVGPDSGTITPSDIYLYKNYKNDEGKLVLNVTSPTNFAVDSFAQVTNLLTDIDPASASISLVGTIEAWTTNVPKIEMDSKCYFGLNGFTSFFAWDFLTKSLTTLSDAPTVDILDKSLCKIAGYDKFFAIAQDDSYLYDVSQDVWTTNILSTYTWTNPYCVALPNRKVFVMGNDSSTQAAQTFDFITGIWQDIGLKAFINNPTNTELAVNDDGRVLISHGLISGTPNDDAVLYDTYENTYIVIPTHGDTGRTDPSIIWHPRLRKFLISGGTIGGVSQTSIQTFDPQTFAWGTLSASNGPALFGHKTQIINDNEIAFSCGETDTGFNSWVWIYNIITDTLTQTSSVSFHDHVLMSIFNEQYLTVWFNLASLVLNRFTNKDVNSANFENDYKIESIDGKSITLAPMFYNELTNSFTPIKAPFLNHLGETTYPTINLVKDSTSADLDGSYLLDKTVPISEFVFDLDQNIEAGTSYNSITFSTIPTNTPDSGFLIFGYGTEYQTGPVEFFEKTSSTTLRIDSNFTFINSIPAGTSVIYAYSSQPLDTISHSTYLVNPSVVRLYAEALIASIKASGSDVNVTTIYPDDSGLGNSGKANSVSDAIYIWGTQEDLDKER